MLSKQRWQEALQIQDAANLSGLVHSFPKVIDDVWEEAREVGQGTRYVNEHPLVRLWLDKLCHLARIQTIDHEAGTQRIMDAYAAAHKAIDTQK